MPLFNATTLLDTAKKSEAEDKQFTPLPEGDYEFVISEIRQVSEDDGKIQAAAKVTSPGERNGNTTLIFPRYSDEASPFVTRLAVSLWTAIGRTEQEFTQVQSVQDIANGLLGGHFAATVKHSKSQDGTRTYANLNNYRPATGTAASGGPQAGPGLPQAPVAQQPTPGLPTPAAPAPAQAQAQAPVAPPVAQYAPAAPAQAPAAPASPQTSFTEPPNPFAG